MSRQVVRSFAIVSTMVLLLAPACGEGEPSGATDVTGSSDSWIAILAVAADSNELGEMTQHVLEVAGTAILVAPATCLEGLPESVALPSDYVLSVYASDREGVVEIASRTGLEPVFVGEVTQLCVD